MLTQVWEAATAAQAAEIDALRTRLEDTVRDSTNKIEALRAEVKRAQYAAGRWENVAKSQASWEMLWSEEKARAERLTEALKQVREWVKETGEQASQAVAAVQPSHGGRIA